MKKTTFLAGTLFGTVLTATAVYVDTRFEVRKKISNGLATFGNMIMRRADSLKEEKSEEDKNEKHKEG